MERASEDQTGAIVDLGAVIAETHGNPNSPQPDGIGDFGGAGLSDD